MATLTATRAPLLIAITGPSGSGKSLLTSGLKTALETHRPIGSAQLSVAIVPEDAYYHSQEHLTLKERANLNFDHPDSLDHDLLSNDLKRLKSRSPVAIPVYDYARHTRSNETHAVSPADIILVEGCLLLSQEIIREQVDYSIFIQTDLSVCLARRVARDTEERGRTIESVHQQFESTVRPMYYAFQEPCAKHAGLIVNGEQEPSRAINATMEKILALLT